MNSINCQSNFNRRILLESAEMANELWIKVGYAYVGALAILTVIMVVIG